MGDDGLAGLTGDEREALAVAEAVYEAVRFAAVLDDPSHWDRFANRLRSAAYAQAAPAFVEQVARRFGLATVHSPVLAALMAADPERARRVLRVVRGESAALSVLVRDRRERRKEAKG